MVYFRLFPRYVIIPLIKVIQFFTNFSSIFIIYQTVDRLVQEIYGIRMAHYYDVEVTKYCFHNPCSFNLPNDKKRELSSRAEGAVVDPTFACAPSDGSMLTLTCGATYIFKWYYMFTNTHQTTLLLFVRQYLFFICL